MSRLRDDFVDRRDQSLLTPEYEDTGLFKSEILALSFDLSPIMFRNSRQDLIVRCYTEAARSFEVTFAGRRSVMASPLIANLEALKAACGKGADAEAGQAAALSDIRVPIKIEGAWRRRFWTDDDGWLTRVHQFVAARWSVRGSAQSVETYGVLPAVGMTAPVH